MTVWPYQEDPLDSFGEAHGLPCPLAGPMLSRAVMGFAAGAVLAVVEAARSGWAAPANDEAPKAAKEMALNSGTLPEN